MLGEDAEEQIVQCLRALETAAERLLDDDAIPGPLIRRARAGRQPTLCQISDDGLEGAWRNGEIEQPIAILGLSRDLDLGESRGDDREVVRLAEIGRDEE